MLTLVVNFELSICPFNQHIVTSTMCVALGLALGLQKWPDISTVLFRAYILVEERKYIGIQINKLQIVVSKEGTKQGSLRENNWGGATLNIATGEDLSDEVMFQLRWQVWERGSQGEGLTELYSRYRGRRFENLVCEKVCGMLF